MQVGDLVRMRPAVAPPQMYGIGIIISVETQARRCRVKWSTMPDREPGSCANYALELVSASR